MILGFSTEFNEAIKSGWKRQTIRKWNKKRQFGPAKFWRDGWGTPIAYYEQAKLDAWLAEVAQKLHGLADFINENPNQDTETLQELEQMNCFDCKHHQLVKNKWCCLLDGKKLENYYGGCKKIEELEVE